MVDFLPKILDASSQLNKFHPDSRLGIPDLEKYAYTVTDKQRRTLL